jgi:hypothetical protein
LPPVLIIAYIKTPPYRLLASCGTAEFATADLGTPLCGWGWALSPIDAQTASTVEKFIIAPK